MFTRRMVSNVAVLAVLVSCLSMTRQGMAIMYYDEDFTSSTVLPTGLAPTDWTYSSDGHVTGYTAAQGATNFTVTEMTSDIAYTNIQFSKALVTPVVGDFIATFKFSWARQGNDLGTMTMGLLGSGGHSVILGMFDGSGGPAPGASMRTDDNDVLGSHGGDNGLDKNALGEIVYDALSDSATVVLTRVGSYLTAVWSDVNGNTFDMFGNYYYTNGYTPTPHAWLWTDLSITGVQLNFGEVLPPPAYSGFNMSASSVDRITITDLTVPEPASLALISLGGLMILRRRRAA